MPLATSYYTVGCKVTAVKSGKKWELEFTHPEILIILLKSKLCIALKIFLQKRKFIYERQHDFSSLPFLNLRVLFELFISRITCNVSVWAYITLQPTPFSSSSYQPILIHMTFSPCVQRLCSARKIGREISPVSIRLPN